MISEERNHKRPTDHEVSRDQSHEAILSVALIRRLPGFVLDVDFVVPAGLTVLFGPSGAGKSMTLQALAGLVALDRAHITFESDVWHDSAKRLMIPPQFRRVGYVPQQYALFPHLTVEQNIAFGIVASRTEKRRRVAELVNLVRLQGVEQLRPEQISGGQQQRVALARALATQPRLLLLDEPFSSLDAPVRETLREELRALQRRVGIPTLMVTHDVQEASALADTMVVISNGSVLQTGSQEAVFRSPRTRSVARLVGMDTCWQGKVVAIDVVADDTSPGHVLVSIQTETDIIQAFAPQASGVSRGQRVDFGIRTDEIRLRCNSGQGEETPWLMPHAAMFPGYVVRTQPRRIMQIVTVRLAGGFQLDVPMMRRECRELELEAGSLVTVQIPPGALHIFEQSTL